MTKIDFKKTLKHLYKPSKNEISIVDVPAMNFLMIDGQGNPNTAKSFTEAIETLYAVSYNLKFMIKKTQQIDYVVLPLEALWWAEEMAEFSETDKDSWLWTAMIMQPEYVSNNLVMEAIETVRAKKGAMALDKLRFESLKEGKSAQVLYIGPYSEEGPSIQNIHKHIDALGGTLAGKHHEIYLSDARRTAPEKLKTIIRQPFK